VSATFPHTRDGPRSTAWWRARPLALGAAGVALALTLTAVWYLASPLFIRTRLDEAAGAYGAPVARGRFGDRDAIHRGSGVATLLRTPGGDHVLQLSDFRVTNGPDLYVYLIPTAGPNTHEDVVGRGALQLGRLKASDGSFAYDLPPGTNPAVFRAAVIYCLQFHTIFSVAPLSPA
jgi:hypothetical protein